jgi:hypothetical protein
MTDDLKKKTETQGQPKRMQNQQKVEKGYQDKREVGDIPLLRLGVASNNFLKFKEALLMAALIQFGDVAKLIEIYSYQCPMKTTLKS